jgi:hypothetical protein
LAVKSALGSVVALIVDVGSMSAPTRARTAVRPRGAPCYERTMRLGRIARALSLGALALGCGDAPESPAPTPTPSTRPAAPSTTTTIPTAPTSTTVAPPTTPDDARRILEQHGIDPDRLSKDIAEQMRHRFDPPAAR